MRVRVNPLKTVLVHHIEASANLRFKTKLHEAEAKQLELSKQVLHYLQHPKQQFVKKTTTKNTSIFICFHFGIYNVHIQF